MSARCFISPGLDVIWSYKVCEVCKHFFHVFFGFTAHATRAPCPCCAIWPCWPGNPTLFCLSRRSCSASTPTTSPRRTRFSRRTWIICGRSGGRASIFSVLLGWSFVSQGSSQFSNTGKAMASEYSAKDCCRTTVPCTHNLDQPNRNSAHLTMSRTPLTCQCVLATGVLHM